MTSENQDIATQAASESNSETTGPVDEEAAEAARKRIPDVVDEARSLGQYGAWTLFVKEIKRFWNIAGQTVISPVLTTMLYFLVFGYSLGDRLREVQGIPYVDFLVPGLVMLSLINNSFVNASFSFFINKIHGTIVDLLVAPLSSAQIVFGFTAASVVRAMMIGGIIWGISLLMGAEAILANTTSSGGLAAIGITVLFMFGTALAFAFLGLSIAILAEDFDHINLLPNFLITPLTFLGGVFYSIEMLPEPWGFVSRFNPILYMVNGLRYGMTGYSDVPLWHGFAVVGSMLIIFGGSAFWLLESGKKIRE
jgi:ABC-2 type transport system permease protein